MADDVLTFYNKFILSRDFTNYVEFPSDFIILEPKAYHKFQPISMWWCFFKKPIGRDR